MYELCRECKTNSGKPLYSKIYADHISVGYRPIALTALRGKKKEPIARNYNPDIWAQVKGARARKYDIYEVWHTETETEAIEDVLFSCFVDGIRYLHIVCTGDKIPASKAELIVEFILHKAYDEEGNKFLEEGYLISDLPKNIWSDDLKIKKYLKKEFEF